MVRIAIFAAMAALLVVALCVPDAFGDVGLIFAVAYGVVRFAQIGLFLVASRDEPELRRSSRPGGRHRDRRRASWSPRSSTARPSRAIWGSPC